MAKTVVITGCSTGVGLETAVLLAKDPQQKYKVFATMRNLGKKGLLEKAAGDSLNKTLFIQELDISKEASIEKFGKDFLEKEGRLDILVNNAAIGQCGVFEKVSMKQAQDLFQTNFFGTMRLTQEFTPLMKKQKSGAIIFVTSDVGFISMPFLEYYVASKHAVEGLVGALAPILRFYNVNVATVQPGPIDTPLMETTATNNQGGFITGNETDVDPLTVKLRNDYVTALDVLRAPEMQSPREIAEVILKAITDPSPKRRYQTSKAVRGRAEAVFKDPDGNVGVDGVEKLLKDSMK